MFDIIQRLLVVILLMLAVFNDLRYRRIPNRLTVTFALIGLGFQVIYSFPMGLGKSLFGMVMGFTIFLIPYLMKGMGAGDVKLMTALGALTDWRTILFIALFSAVAGGIITTFLQLVDGGVYRTFRKTGRLIAFYFYNLLFYFTHLPTHALKKDFFRNDDPHVSNEYIPYAVAIAIGTVFFLVFSYVGLI